MELSVKRPTPTTIQYTVSTRAADISLSARLRRVLVALVRVVVGLASVVVLAAHVRLAERRLKGLPATLPLSSSWPTGVVLLSTLISDLVETQAGSVDVLAGTLPGSGSIQHHTAHHPLSPLRPLLLPVLCLLLVNLALRRPYTTESLLVVRGLGVQTSTSAGTYLSAAATRFIPATDIRDVFIHEAFCGFEVRFYLAIVVEGEDDVVVVFPNLIPRRAILEDVWRGARACLYEPRKER